MSTPTAFWPLPSLLRSLSRAGWGDLAGREYQGVRSTLTALANRLPDKSAEGLATAEQISAAAGLSERWVRRCLTVLEDLGLITWQRGGVIDGRPAPSFFQVVKTRLVALIGKARGSRAEAEAEHRATTAERIRKAGLTYTMRPRRRGKKKSAKSSRSAHAELSASLSTPYGGMPLRGNSHPGNKEEIMFSNLQMNDEQANELAREAAHRHLIETKRRVARENAIRSEANQAIQAHRAELGEGTDFKQAAISYALARFTKKGKAAA